MKQTITTYEFTRRAKNNESLPDNLQVSGWLYLSGCTGLTALPDNLQVSGWLDLSGCTGLKEKTRAAARKKYRVV